MAGPGVGPETLEPERVPRTAAKSGEIRDWAEPPASSDTAAIAGLARQNAPKKKVVKKTAANKAVKKRRVAKKAIARKTSTGRDGGVAVDATGVSSAEVLEPRKVSGSGTTRTPIEQDPMPDWDRQGMGFNGHEGPGLDKISDPDLGDRDGGPTGAKRRPVRNPRRGIQVRRREQS